MRFHDVCAFSYIFGKTSHDAEGELTRHGVERRRFIIDRGRLLRDVRSTSGAESRVDGGLVVFGVSRAASLARGPVRKSRRRRRRETRARDVGMPSRVIARRRAFESAHHLAKRAHFLGDGGDFRIHRASRRRRRGTRRSRGISRTRVLVVFGDRDARGRRRRRRPRRRRRRSRRCARIHESRARRARALRARARRVKSTREHRSSRFQRARVAASPTTRASSTRARAADAIAFEGLLLESRPISTNHDYPMSPHARPRAPARPRARRHRATRVDPIRSRAREGVEVRLRARPRAVESRERARERARERRKKTRTRPTAGISFPRERTPSSTRDAKKTRDDAWTCD